MVCGPKSQAKRNVIWSSDASSKASLIVATQWRSILDLGVLLQVRDESSLRRFDVLRLDAR